MVLTVWGVNYSGEERRPAAGEGGGGGGGPHLLSGPHGGFLQGVGRLELPLPPVEGAQVLQGGGHRGAAETRRMMSSRHRGVVEGRPPPVPHRPVYFTSLVPAAVLSEGGTVLLLPLEDKTPPPEDETRVPPRLATGTPLNAVSAHLALFLSLFGVHPYRFVLICRGKRIKNRRERIRQRSSSPESPAAWF